MSDWTLDKLESAMLGTYMRELDVKLHDSERLKEVYGSHFFDQSTRAKLDGICATAAQLLETEYASINLVTEDSQITVATFGAERAYVGLDSSYCQHVVGEERELSISDSLKHALVCNSVQTTQNGIRAYLGVPLMTRGGHILGALCVWATEQREWTPSEVSMLTELAVVVMRFHQVA